MLAALPIENGAGFPIGEKLVGYGANFEAGFDPGVDVRESVEATDQGMGLHAVVEPGIGLETDLAWERGDVSCALH